MSATAAKLNVEFSSSGVGKVTNDISGVGKALNSANGQGRGFFSNMMSTAGGFLVAGGLTQIKDNILGIGGAMITSNSNMEMWTKQLEVSTGSIDGANAVIKNMTQMAKISPFDLPQLIQSANALESLGFSSQKWMPIIGDTAAATGKSVDQVTQAVMDASTGEFERLKELGIKTKVNGDMIAFSFKKNGEWMTVEAENTAEGIETALMDIWGDKYSGAMETMSNTWTGRMGNLKDTVNMALMDMGKPLFDFMKEAVSGATNYLDIVRRHIESGNGVIFGLMWAIPEMLRNMGLDRLASMIVPAIKAIVTGWRLISSVGRSTARIVGNTLGKAFEFLGEHMDVVKAVGKALLTVIGGMMAWGIITGIVSGLVGVLGALLSPLALLIAAVAALYLAWDNNWFGIRDITASVWEAIEPIFNWIKDAVQWIAEGFEIGGWEEAWSRIKLVVSDAWDAIKRTLNVDSLPDLGGLILEKLRGLVVSIAKGAWNLIMGEPVVDSELGIKIDTAIENLIGRAFAFAIRLALNITEVAVAFTFGGGLKSLITSKWTALAIGAGLIGMALPALGLSLPILPIIVIAAGIGLSVLIFNQLEDYIAKNPVEALKVALEIGATIEKVTLDMGWVMLKFAMWMGNIESNIRGMWDAFWGLFKLAIDVAMPDINWPDMPKPPSWMTTPPQWWINTQAGRLPWDNGDSETGGGGTSGDRNVTEGNPGSGGSSGFGDSSGGVTRTTRESDGGGKSMPSLPNLAGWVIATAAVDTYLKSLQALNPTSQQAAIDNNLMASSVLPVGVNMQTAGTQVGTAGAGIGSTFAGIAASALSNFTAAQTSATSQMGALAAGATAQAISARSNVVSQFASMSSGTLASSLGMQVGVAARMAALQASVTSQASSARANAVSQFSSMSAGAAGKFMGMQAQAGVQMAIMASTATTKGNATSTNMVGAIAGGVARVAAAALGWVSAVSGAGNAAAAIAVGYGRNISFGLAEGIWSGIGAVSAAASAIVGAAAAAIHVRGMFGSPSRLMRKYGQWWDEGLVLGIRDGMADVARAAESLFGTGMPSPAFSAPLHGGGFGGGGQQVVNNYYQQDVKVMTSAEWEAYKQKSERGNAAYGHLADPQAQTGRRGRR